jgi:hypothetical protein
LPAAVEKYRSPPSEEVSVSSDHEPSALSLLSETSAKL